MNLKHQFTEVAFFSVIEEEVNVSLEGFQPLAYEKIATECLLSLMENLSLPFFYASFSLLASSPRPTSPSASLSFHATHKMNEKLLQQVLIVDLDGRQTLEYNQTHSLSTS